MLEEKYLSAGIEAVIYSNEKIENYNKMLGKINIENFGTASAEIYDYKNKGTKTYKDIFSITFNISSSKEKEKMIKNIFNKLIAL